MTDKIIATKIAFNGIHKAVWYTDQRQNPAFLEKYKDNCWMSFFLKYYPLIIALIVTGIYLFPRPDMLGGGGGDAADIWKTITTWHSSEVYGSYVLYKGFESVYPYVWFYDLSGILNIDDWFFIKCYYIVMFAVSTTVLLPKIVEKLTGNTAKSFTKLILFVVCYLFWVPAGVFCLMVDLPSLFYFLILVLLALCFDKYSKSILYWVSLGFMMGLNLCSSGQYTLAAVAVAIYLLVRMIKAWKGSESRINWAFCIPLIVVALVIKEYNNYFLDEIVGELRANGAWIPSANNWLEIGFLRFMPVYRQGYGISIVNDRGYEILQNYYGEEYEFIKNAIFNGAYPITIWEYFDIVIHEPLDCLVMYGVRLYLMVSPDRGSLNFFPLLISYSLLFIALWYGVSKCREMRQIFSSKFWIGAAFLFAIVPCLVLTYEARYAIQLQGLIFAIAICVSGIWSRVPKVFSRFKKNIGAHEDKSFKVNYVVVAYVVFLLFCFMMTASLYANSIDPNFYWWCPKYHWWT